VSIRAEEGWIPVGTDVQLPREKGRPPVYSKYILQDRWDAGMQPVQKMMLDKCMEKYHLPDQDWPKKMQKS